MNKEIEVINKKTEEEIKEIRRNAMKKFQELFQTGKVPIIKYDTNITKIENE